MLDLTSKTLPDTINVDGSVFYLHTDYRLWLKFIIELKENYPIDRYSYLYAGNKPTDLVKGFKELLSFAFPKKELPRSSGANSDRVVLDFSIDADLIYSAFMQQYHIDLLDTDMHFYKFLALLDGLKNTLLNDVMGYRCYTKSNKSHEQYMLECLHAWEISSEMILNEEEKKILEEFDNKINTHN